MPWACWRTIEAASWNALWPLLMCSFTEAPVCSRDAESRYSAIWRLCWLTEFIASFKALSKSPSAHRFNAALQNQWFLSVSKNMVNSSLEDSSYWGPTRDYDEVFTIETDLFCNSAVPEQTKFLYLTINVMYVRRQSTRMAYTLLKKIEKAFELQV